MSTKDSITINFQFIIVNQITNLTEAQVIANQKNEEALLALTSEENIFNQGGKNGRN